MAHVSLADGLRKFLETEEGKKEFEEYFHDVERRENVRDSQLKRLHQSGKFKEFTEKVIAKYSTNEYADRWLKRHIEPEEALYWFLFFYAKKYGTEATNNEYDLYGNMFTSELYHCEGYWFNKMDGQGSVIQISNK